MEAAISREKAIKEWKRAWKISLIENRFAGVTVNLSVSFGR